MTFPKYTHTVLYLGFTGLVGLGLYHLLQTRCPFSTVFKCKRGPPVPTFVDNNAWIDLKLSKITDVNHNCKLFRFDLPSKNHVTGIHVASALLTQFQLPSQPPVIRAYTPVSTEETLGIIEQYLSY